MGNSRFKLSELIPNAWFYKLRDMGKSRKNSTASPSPIKKHQTVPTPTTTARSPRRRRSSYYYSRPRKAAPPPRKSTTTAKSTASTSSDSSSTVTGTVSFSPEELRSDQLLIPESPCSCVTFTELDLRPIITKPANKPTTVVRKTAVSSPAEGVRLRLRSPRISTRKSAASSRRSRAVVKATVDPRRDFKESMEEMIKENNIRESKDLEELLACYLCLNSDEYHHIIINVFKQIWLDLNHLSPHK